jgi:hypothetical protein
VRPPARPAIAFSGEEDRLVGRLSRGAGHGRRVADR